MNAERPTLVRDPQDPIDPFFHKRVRCLDHVVNLIEAPLVYDRAVPPQAAECLEAQNAVQLSLCRTGPRQIRCLRWLNSEAPVLDRQIARQELIRRVQRGDIHEPLVACLRHPFKEAPDVAWRLPREGACLNLREFLLTPQANRSHQPECLHTQSFRNYRPTACPCPTGWLAAPFDQVLRSSTMIGGYRCQVFCY